MNRGKFRLPRAVFLLIAQTQHGIAMVCLLLTKIINSRGEIVLSADNFTTTRLHLDAYILTRHRMYRRFSFARITSVVFLIPEHARTGATHAEIIRGGRHVPHSIRIRSWRRHIHEFYTLFILRLFRVQQGNKVNGFGNSRAPGQFISIPKARYNRKTIVRELSIRTLAKICKRTCLATMFLRKNKGCV